MSQLLSNRTGPSFRLPDGHMNTGPINAESRTATPIPGEAPPLLSMRQIRKKFGGVEALRGVDFELQTGSVHALLGENGAGKSTLVKIIAGAHRPDEGEIRLAGEQIVLATPGIAQEAGIAVMYQETSLFGDLSVLENLFMGRQPLRRFALIDWPRMRKEAQAIFRRLGIDLPLNARLESLRKAEMQLVEIAKALLQRARILIMDEPTASLTEAEVARLFGIVSGLRVDGVGIIYISHRLDEIERIADRVTVFRDGMNVGGGAVAKIGVAEVAKLMVGSIVERIRSTARPRGRPLLEVDGLGREGTFTDIGFTLHAGEVLGLAGLVGAGRTEVARAIAGIDAADAGDVRIDGAPAHRGMARRAKLGIGLLPEDRGRQGLVLPLPVRANLSLSALSRFSRWNVVDRGAEAENARRMIADLSIRPGRPELPTLSLSGGNQQKVALGRLLATRPKVLILDEPTQGVDVGARAEIHRMIRNLVENGLGVLLISSDLPEVVDLADRILVMRRGRIVSELPQGSTPDEIMLAASGGSAAAMAHVH